MARFDRDNPETKDGGAYERTLPGHRMRVAPTDSDEDYVSPEEKAEALAYFVARRAGKGAPVLLNPEAAVTPSRSGHLRLVTPLTRVVHEELPVDGPLLPPYFWWYAAGAGVGGFLVTRWWLKRRRHPRSSVPATGPAAPAASSPSEKPAELVGLDVLCCLGAA